MQDHGFYDNSDSDGDKIGMVVIIQTAVQWINSAKAYSSSDKLRSSAVWTKLFESYTFLCSNMFVILSVLCEWHCHTELNCTELDKESLGGIIDVHMMLLRTPV